MLALSLSATLLAFGCTTNQNPGNGYPLQGGPGARDAAPTSGVTSGTSSGNVPVNPPMMSSSTYIEPLPAVTARTRRLPLSPEDAADVMRQLQMNNRTARVLGPANPGAAAQTSASDFTGGFRDPALATNPQLTVNSSIYSVNRSGIVGAVGVGSPATTTGATSATGTATPSPAAATLPFTPGTLASGTGTLTPTVAAGVNPSPTVATSNVLGTTTGTTAASSSPAVTSNAVTARGTTTGTGTVVAPIRVLNNNGKVTVTNTSASGGKSQ